MPRLLPTTAALTLTACGADPLLGSWDCTLLIASGIQETCPTTEIGEESTTTRGWGFDFDYADDVTVWRLQLYDYDNGQQFDSSYSYSIRPIVSGRNWRLEVEEIGLDITCSHAGSPTCVGLLDGESWRVDLAPATLRRE